MKQLDKHTRDNVESPQGTNYLADRDGYEVPGTVDSSRLISAERAVGLNGRSVGTGSGGQSLASSFRCAFAGVAYAVRTQRNVRIHLAVGLLVAAVGTWLGLSAVEWTLLIIIASLVFAAEMVNTALESLADWPLPLTIR